ncbi:MAG: hypothetical protein J6O51_07450 [Bacteroidales bacterium]|nr:hypothetical protein [Bacteroidales bacterium]
MKRTASILILLLLGCSVFAQGLSLEEVKSDVRRAAAWYAPYHYTSEAVTPQAPRGFKPFNISTYARHGARLYSKEALYDQMHKLVNIASDSGLLTPLGEDLFNKSEAVYHTVRGRAYDLTEYGQQQHRTVAGRIMKSWKKVFRGRRTIVARSTQTNRTILSMTAALDQYRRLDPKLNIRFDASASDMGILNPTSKYNPRAEERDWSRAFEADTARWNPAFKALWKKNMSDPERFFGRFFKDPAVVLKVYKDYINAARMFYFYLSFSETLGPDASLMYMLESEDAWRMWECENFRMYSCCGATPIYYGRNWALEEALLRDLVKYMKEDIAGGDVAARLRFGHDYKISGTLVLLEAEGWDHCESDPEKVWRIYDYGHMPMASTLLFTLFRNSSGEVLVRCTLDEVPQHFPIDCYTDPRGQAWPDYYRWKDFEAHCSARLALADKILETT